MTSDTALNDLPAGLVIFSTDGKAQFGWQNSETGVFHAEDDGHLIVNAVGAAAWHAVISH